MSLAGRDYDDIDALYAAWQSAFRRHNVEAVIDLVTEDYVLLTPGRPPIGVEALRSQLIGAFADYDIEPRFERVELLTAGGLAVDCGWDVQTLRPRGGGPSRTQRQLVLLVLLRSPEGRWRFARGMAQPGPAA